MRLAISKWKEVRQVNDQAGQNVSQCWPTQIRVSKDKSYLHVSFEDGTATSITAELLRVESPSAEVQGHGAGQKTTPAGKRNVTISRIDPIGNYAIRIAFSDGHDTGLFTWGTLLDYGQRHESLMADYERRLTELGLNRG
tara:strand:+ start:50 stop:469 length:420 start_codon:yes stop_codon:yes gene_type:complete